MQAFYYKYVVSKPKPITLLTSLWHLQGVIFSELTKFLHNQVIMQLDIKKLSEVPFTSSIQSFRLHVKFLSCHGDEDCEMWLKALKKARK